MNEYDYQQIAPKADTSSNLLDLIFTNIPNTTCDISIDPLVLLDKYHPPLIISLDIRTRTYAPPTYTNCNRRRFYAADYGVIKVKLNLIDWSFIDDPKLLLDYIVDWFYKILDNLINEFVPKSLPTTHQRPPWLTSEIIREVKVKKTLQ
ncbi:uncharacterized protein LOC112906559 [Agrilus planipennis]|uniref:Uncharacterized protein LOC112906559 n=1 Tax=Agrilus planipennis TaxID=224129 RepID=A0A7F5RLF8_AGRPL|nr:uncharacterized protein LOC112906559 [Agrilus planipennis]